MRTGSTSTCSTAGPASRRHLPTIFQPFFRSHPSKNNVDGHGLGLAIAERVVHRHGGTIRAMNREGGGLQVAIVLPLAV